MKRRVIVCLSLLLFASLLFSGCAKSYDKGDSYAFANASMESEKIKSEIGNEDLEISGRKLIRNMEMSVETKTYDSLISDLKEKVANVGGYVESARENGRAGDYRYANFTIRIPSDKLDLFSDELGKLCTVTYRSENVLDVTENYVDIESHIRALEIEQKAFETMLEKSSSTSETLDIYKQLSEVNYQLDSLKARLKSYDSKIEFSTVSLTVNEVEVLTRTQELTVWQEIGQGFVDNLSAVGAFFVDLFVWLVSSLPVLIVIAAAIFLVVFIIVKSKKKRDQKKAQK